MNLQDQPLKVLECLLERPGELVTREAFRERLWPGDTFVDFEQGLNAAVKRLRETLGDSAESPRFVETLPRRGYRFIAPVRRGDRDGPNSPPRQGLSTSAWRTSRPCGCRRDAAGSFSPLASGFNRSRSDRSRALTSSPGCARLLLTQLPHLSVWSLSRGSPVRSMARPSHRMVGRWRLPGTANSRTTPTSTSSLWIR